MVRGTTENSSAILPAHLTVRSDPEEIQVSEKAQITFTLSDPEGNPLAGEPVQIFFSEDGFTWLMEWRRECDYPFRWNRCDDRHSKSPGIPLLSGGCMMDQSSSVQPTQGFWHSLSPGPKTRQINNSSSK